MAVQHLTELDSERARRLWAEYQRRHDLSDRKGQTAGIDPVSERIWFGDSIEDVVAKCRADGFDVALVFERVGYETYYRKGGCR